ncbi:ABC transporter ATP-binding protein [Pedococcus aerophilus]|uniref:ABC transporter ATP-binding protein n=1 Tax=Pedococcus aerophilus TaxID=436356 RepID=A0ABN3UN90_9MICO
MSTTPVVHVHHAVVRHGTSVLVDVEDLRLAPGRALTIVGESGSGKSVLAHAVMGTLPRELAPSGRVDIDGCPHDLADRGGRRALWGRRLALLPQEPVLALDPTMRVRGQVAEGARGWRPRSREALLEADRRLRGVGLGGATAAYPHMLSGGMAQRAAYAAATIGGAEVLIVDEPSKGLDPAALDALATLLQEHLERGGALLTITHDIGLARRLGGEVWVMRESAVVERGPSGRVLSEPEHPYSRELLAAEPSRWDRPWMRATEPSRDGEPLVQAQGVTVEYGGRPVLRDLDLAVHPEDRLAVSGPSGAGKSTAADVLLGLVPPTRGRVRRGPAVRDGGFQKLYQEPTPSFPARVPLGVGLADVARRYGAAPGRVAELLEGVAVRSDLLARRPGQVSGGELQRIALVRALLARPVLLVADEATSRLDLASQAWTVDCLMTEVEEHGCALVAVTHDSDLAAAVGSRRLELTAPPTGSTRD